jgi:hypothetical protein
MHDTSGGQAGYLSLLCPDLRSNVLWVAFFYSVGLIITREKPCILKQKPHSFFYHKNL